MRDGDFPQRRLGMTFLVLLLALAMARSASAAPAQTQTAFATPEAAAEKLVAALRDNDDAALLDLFGHAYADRLLAKEKAAATEGRQRLYRAAQDALALRRETQDFVVLVFGKEAWPFPIPLVRSGTDWRFHTAAGLEEITNRRIGAGERNAIRVCRAYVAAQWDYARKIRDDSGVRKFARRLRSSPDKQDGLYWDPAVAHGEESPFGPLVAEYLSGGRAPGEPYQGYYFRVLTRQGRHAPGGRYSYVINSNMIAGFALVAFPAEYGHSGVMTFLVSHHGKVYQKDLGPQTSRVAAAMREYDPDPGWHEVTE
jgi:hypothetical protein